MITKEQKTFLKKTTPLAVFLGGLCCFTPLVLALLGISSIAYAASLADILYGEYKWVFRGIALLTLLTAVFWYFYKKEGVCTLDGFKKKRTQIINVTLLALLIGVLGYIIWLYVIVHYAGVLIGLWN